MLGPFLCGLLSQAPLLPKLRGHFAEFLNNASSVGLRILSSSTCVGLWYGHMIHNSGFSWRRGFTSFSTEISIRVRLHVSLRGFPQKHHFVLAPVFPFPALVILPRPHSSDTMWYRNLNLLSIDYASRPRLRPRLTQGRSALPWKPWIFGRKDSHLTLATHSGILSSLKSTAPSGTASSLRQCSSTDPFGSRGFGVVFQPRTFSARHLSTSELLRTLSMHGCF